MQMARQLVEAIALKRIWWFIMIPPLLLGSLYGFYWYWPQLQATPIYLWPIVPDSPGSSMLLCIWLICLVAGADWRKPGMQWLGAIAFISNMKYGLWTPMVNTYTGLTYGWSFDLVHLSISHGAMWFLGLLFARYYKPAILPSIGALLFMWFQDLVDYVLLGTHPTLWHIELRGLAFIFAVSLSTIWGCYLVGQALVEQGSIRGSARG